MKTTLFIFISLFACSDSTKASINIEAYADIVSDCSRYDEILFPRSLDSVSIRHAIDNKIYLCAQQADTLFVVSDNADILGSPSYTYTKRRIYIKHKGDNITVYENNDKINPNSAIVVEDGPDLWIYAANRYTGAGNYSLVKAHVTARQEEIEIPQLVLPGNDSIPDLDKGIYSTIAILDPRSLPEWTGLFKMEQLEYYSRYFGRIYNMENDVAVSCDYIGYPDMDFLGYLDEIAFKVTQPPALCELTSEYLCPESFSGTRLYPHSADKPSVDSCLVSRTFLVMQSGDTLLVVSDNIALFDRDRLPSEKFNNKRIKYIEKTLGVRSILTKGTNKVIIIHPEATRDLWCRFYFPKDWVYQPYDGEGTYYVKDKEYAVFNSGNCGYNIVELNLKKGKIIGVYEY